MGSAAAAGGKPMRRSMREFFDDGVLLHSATARRYYDEVKNLPIVDYHSHLSERDIAQDRKFSTVTGLWLAADHYKWRAMRSCGVEERFITGDASDEEKFCAYASVMPKLLGSPLYYWTHFELKKLFKISKPLNERTAKSIYREANEKLKTLSVRTLLKEFNVEYIATTNDPVETLEFHGIYDGIKVCPTFRPDKALRLERAYLEALGRATGREICTLGDWKSALRERLAFFMAKGCTIADTSVEESISSDIGEEEAAALFEKGEGCTPAERRLFYSYGMHFLGGLFAECGIVWQLHIGALRNINERAHRALGCDAGYDVMRGDIDTDEVARFLNRLHGAGKLPKTVLYSLNKNALPALCTIAACFPDVRLGAAWWFNDTLKGISEHLETLAEYSVFGLFPGMLTDSRSFSSYCRFDFFRRILCNYVAEKVDAGEYDRASASRLLFDICYQNPKTFMNI